MKGNFIKQNLKKVLVILLIIAISLISFIGIYWKKDGRYQNILSDYNLGMNLKGYRAVRLKVDDSTKEIIKDKDGNIIESATEEEITQNGYTKEEVPVNSQDVLTEENYKKIKEILEKRFEMLEVPGYEIRLDNETGAIVLNIVEDTNTDYMISGAVAKGTFEVRDEETGEVLIGKEHLKKVSMQYGTLATTAQTAVYLNIEFDKEGKEKLAQLSETYVTTTAEDGTTTEKKIAIYIDDTNFLSTSFDEKITDGIIQLSVGYSSGEDMQAINGAKITVAELNTETMPIEYVAEENNYINLENSENKSEVLIAVGIVLILIMLIIKHKNKGILAAISYIGQAATFLLLLRLLKIEISIEGIFSIIAVQIINYVLIDMILKNLQKNNNKKEIDNAILKFFFTIIPLYIISVVFTFISYLPIYSFGMVMFWGLSVVLLYNMLFSKILLTNNKEVEVEDEE